MGKLTKVPSVVKEEEESEGKALEDEVPKLEQAQSTLRLRRDMPILPRVVHRALDKNDVHKATVTLIELFTLIV
jgi:hypothetical protein